MKGIGGTTCSHPLKSPGHPLKPAGHPLNSARDEGGGWYGEIQGEAGKEKEKEKRRMDLPPESGRSNPQLQ